jgi:hypothetical protein
VGGFPAQELLGDATGKGHVRAEQVREDAAEFFSRERSRGKVQVPTDDLGNMASRSPQSPLVISAEVEIAPPNGEAL